MMLLDMERIELHLKSWKRFTQNHFPTLDEMLKELRIEVIK